MDIWTNKEVTHHDLKYNWYALLYDILSPKCKNAEEAFAAIYKKSGKNTYINRDHKELYELRMKGYSFKELEEMLNMDKSYIYRMIKKYCDENKLEMPKAKRINKDKLKTKNFSLTLKEFEKLSETRTFKQIAEEKGINLQTVYNTNKRYREMKDKELLDKKILNQCIEMYFNGHNLNELLKALEKWKKI